MAIQFEKVVPQIERMGATLADRSHTVTEQIQVGGQRLMELDDLDAIWDQIMIARKKDAGFRGAAPFDEPINQPIPLPDCPPRATILASDGSQIYPDPHGAALYWLTNIGVFVYGHGEDVLPETITEPQLFYEDHDVRDADGRIIATAAINARRTVQEMQLLARESVNHRAMARPLVALYDGPLLTLPTGKEVPNKTKIDNDYFEALDIFRDLRGALAGYVDRPRSTFVVSTIYLMTLGEADITRANLQTAGPLEGLTDRDLYEHILTPGDRSGLMIQQSPQNKNYKERNPEQEIVFFYMNVASLYQEPYLARVEVPMWLAEDKGMVGAVQALIYAQCQITDRYPYALTRADEIAVVHAHEKRALDELIAVELLRNQQTLEVSQKLSSKSVARRERQHHQGV
ncbi:MAG: DNA double-strand break repair nuclease NurA [Anaerolineae bacterium]|nr:DNA double-strand break repair nuclease NurA [Anaerolineae bacterium]